MSALSSVGSGSSSLLLQSLKQQQVSRANGSDPDGDGDQHGGGGAARFTTALKSLGLDDTKVATIQSQIQDALTSAKSQNQSADGRAAFKAAIDGVLQQNGVDLSQFRQAIQKAGGGHGAHRAHRHHAESQTSTESSPTSAASDQNTTDANAAATGVGTQVDVAA